jgi:hypothetical protein
VTAQAIVELTSPNAGHDPCGLLGVAARPDPEVVVGCPQAELVEEHLTHRRVVVLPGVNDADFTAARLEGVDHGLELHEVGSSTCHAREAHVSTSCLPQG